MKKIYSLILAMSLFLMSSCDLDLLDSPNAVTSATASPTFLVNSISGSYVSLFNGNSTFGMRLTRIMSQPSNLYEQAYIPPTFNGIWSNAYSNILNDIKFLEGLHENSPIPRHLAIARTIKALTLMNMVDLFDEIPFSEALDPNIFNPKVDPGAAVYQAAFEALQQAKANFAEPTANLPRDFFYGTGAGLAPNVARWTKLINTLELRYHLNRKLVDAAGSRTAINALLSGGNLLGAGDDFVFRYGTSQSDPDSRHPRFSAYGSGGGNYQSNWYMFHLTEAKGFDDPRVRYYIYRQVTVNPTDADKLRCIGEIAPGHYLAGGWPFCLPGDRGYWGRDHLNAEGIPPDNFEQTQYGLFPAGGKFDNGAGTPVNSPTLGASGAGIQPIMLAGYVDFMLAEAALTLGTTGDAKAFLVSGIKKHMNYVRAYAVSTPEAAVVRTTFPDASWTLTVNNYVDFVEAEWDAAPANAKMNLVGREYWLALYGNGVEAYNLYRRTGTPGNMQPGLLANFGDFPRSYFYPNNYLVTNINAVQKASQRQRVFWDTNPEGNDWVY